MAAFLITGNPGSGRTTLAGELARRGFTALDTDRIAGGEAASGTPGEARRPGAVQAAPGRWGLNLSETPDAVAGQSGSRRQSSSWSPWLEAM